LGKLAAMALLSRPLTIIIPLVLLSALAGALVGAQLFARPLPWWSDAGEWLAYAHGVQGELALLEGNVALASSLLGPLWGISPWQYPPLFFLLLMAASLPLGNELLALKALAVALYCLQPAAIFVFVGRITSRGAALISSAAAALAPITTEMLGWGGYPNLLGFVLLPPTLACCLRYCSDGGRQNLLAAAACGVLVILAHHLTSLVLMGTALLAALLSFAARRHRWLVGGEVPRAAPRRALVIAGLYASAFALYRALTWPPQFIFSNQAAAYWLSPDVVALVGYIFKEALPIALTSASLFAALGCGRKVLSPMASLWLLSWGLAPLLIIQGQYAGIYVDYRRIFLFVVQPIYAALPIPLAWGIRKLRGSSFMASRRPRGGLPALLLIALSLSSSLSLLFSGLASLPSTLAWYSANDPYGSGEKLQALEWIRANTSTGSVFVADELMGRWIQGYGMRRVYIYDQPEFLFLQGQAQRSRIAESVLLSSFTLRGCAWTAFLQEPLGLLASLNWHAKPVPLIFIPPRALVAYQAFTNGTVRALDAPALRAATTYSYNASEDPSDPAVLLYSFDLRPESGRLVNVTLLAEFPSANSVSAGEAPSSLSIDTRFGRVYLSSSGLLIRLDSGKAVYAFPAQNGEVRGLFRVSFQSPFRGERCDISATRTQDLLLMYNITYVVIPRTGPVDGPLETLPFFDHLLLSPFFRVAYVNAKVIVLRYCCEAAGAWA
jgi:hypothetical protein